jgi:ribonuclease BN (tRNA processing enzyme)
MLVQICGARGSVPSPGPDMVRYGGNTSCLLIRLSDGTTLVLDAGTGMRNVVIPRSSERGHLHILLTHLHLDHIQGLLFFSPLYEPRARITIWGPSAAGPSLKNRIARYLSAPLTPIEVRELPCELDFRHCPVSEWSIGPARVSAAAVTHRGPTLGFRIEDAGTSLCYLPDHEPALVGSLADLETEWISGYALGQNADLLIHDCQYTDAEYPAHFGWGHSALSHALEFANRSGAARTLLFHHDPFHTDDQLDAIGEEAVERWQAMGHSANSVSLAVEGEEITVDAHSRVPGRAA